MNTRTIVSGTILIAVVIAVTYLFGISAAMFSIAAYNIFIGILQLMGRDKYDKVMKEINPDRFAIYESKDKAFKERIKPDPIGSFLLAALFIYIGYRALINPITIGLRQYGAVGIFIAMAYFLETIVLKRSNTWMEYRRLTAYLALGTLALALVLI